MGLLLWEPGRRPFWPRRVSSASPRLSISRTATARLGLLALNRNSSIAAMSLACKWTCRRLARVSFPDDTDFPRVPLVSFGDEIVQFKNGTAHATHAKNGFWHGPKGPRNRHVGVLLLPQTGLWKLREEQWQPVLAVNPWAERQLPDALRKLRRFEVDNGCWMFREGERFANVVGLPNPWPPA